MARPISWQTNLAELHRRVQESPRSIYAREDLERLFGVRKGAALKLLELMPRLQQGNALLVEREHLVQFLAACRNADDLTAFLAELRRNPPKVSRRKLRISLPAQLEAGNVQSIDRWNIELRRGKITVHFTTLDDLAGKLVQLTKVIDAPEFERRFCEAPVAIAASAEYAALKDESAMIRAHNRFFVKTAAADEAARRPDTLPGVREELLAEAAAALAEYRELAQQLGLVPEDLEARAQHLPSRIGPDRALPADAAQQTGT